MNLNLELVYHEFDNNLRKFIHRRVFDADASEDILQDVYLKIHDGIDKLREPERLTPWVFQIARNAIVDHHRRSHPESDLEEDLVALPTDEPDLYAELASTVHGMLACLPMHYRKALELADLQGMKQDDVAKILGLSLSGVKSRVQRARQKLKQAFLACCHFEFDHNGRAVEFQSNCGHCSENRSDDGCVDQSCGDESVIQEQACH